MNSTLLYSPLQEKLTEIIAVEISEERKKLLQPLIDYLKNNGQNQAKLNFICTHNSRRSQMAQVWAQLFSSLFDVDVLCYSGGTQVDTFHSNAIQTLKKCGFGIKSGKGKNPVYTLKYSFDLKPVICYSKLYEAPANPQADFAAIMTCSEAEENCPLIPGAAMKISLPYKDPKEFDDDENVLDHYMETSDQIAAEMRFVFKNACGNP